MPTYEFRCPKGHDFERFFGRISEAPSEVACPECGELATRLISGGAGLIFKGSGFYITDYGKDGKKDQRAASQAPRSGESRGGDKKGGESGGGEGKGNSGGGGDSSKSAGGKGGDSGGGSDGGSSSDKSATKPASPAPKAGE